MSSLGRVASSSLARTLTVRLVVTTMVVMLLQAGIVSVRDYLTETDFLNGYVRREAKQIAREIEASPKMSAGKPSQYYGEHAAAYAFRVLDKDGRVIAGERPQQLEKLSPWSNKPSDREDLWLRKINPNERMHVAGGIKLRQGDRDLWVELATFGDPAQTYVESIALDTINDLWVPMLPLATLTLIVTFFTVRLSLRPLRAAAERADEMSVLERGERLDVAGLPAEASHFALAVNRLLDRVADLVAAQRLLIARAAHELRTPLSIMMLELGRLKDPNGKRLEADIREMSAIVDQLLSLARIEGARKSEMAPVDVATVVRELVSRLLDWAEKDGHKLNFKAERDMPILGDEQAIRDAVRNLIENAVKHTPSGTQINVEVRPDSSVVVEDSGPGIDPEMSADLKLPFRKGSTTTEGAGLGLAIVEQTAALHGGRLDISKSPLGGASFRLYLASSVRQ